MGRGQPRRAEYDWIMELGSCLDEGVCLAGQELTSSYSYLGGTFGYGRCWTGWIPLRT